MTARAIVLFVAVLLAAAPAAEAATRRGTDRDASIRFVLVGRSLTVSLLAAAPKSDRRRVQGRRIRFVCGTDFDFTRGVRVREIRTWRPGRTRLRLRLDRDISRRAKWCLLEHPRGGDLAFANLA